MNQIHNKIDQWRRPWNITKFDDLTTRDERFFSIVIKGCLNYLNRTILMYNEPINHFIFNTGSAIMYVESNGYEFKWVETTGEDQMYMHLPRCICEINDINIPISDLTNPYVRGTYERRSSKTNEYKGYNAQIRRLPLEISMNLRYVLSNFNESIILVQEIIDKLVFQQYFNVNYLGQIIQCSIEFPVQTNININKIDFDSTETNQRTIEIQIKINTNYPIINELTEIENSKVIETLESNLNVMQDNEITDTDKYTIN
jgi:hypothetical protein